MKNLKNYETPINMRYFLIALVFYGLLFACACFLFDCDTFSLYLMVISCMWGRLSMLVSDALELEEE